MADRIVGQKVICRGGLNSNENSLELSDSAPGSATRLINYEPSLYGGYRRINGFVQWNKIYPIVSPSTAEGKILGVFSFKNPFTKTNEIYAARKDLGANTYSFYRDDKSLGWTKINTGTTQSYTLNDETVYKIRSAKYNFGDGNRIIFVDGVNPALHFDGFNWVKLIVSPTVGVGSNEGGGDQIVVAPSVVQIFENHVFFASDPDFLGVVAHSAPLNALDWKVANGAGQITTGFDVVQIKPFRENLFVFGENDIKKITVATISGEPNFSISNVTSNVGCVAKDSVVEIGGDLVFLSPDGYRPVAGTSKIGDVELETISKPIQQKLLELNQEYDLRTVDAVIVRGKSQVRFFYGDDTMAVNASRAILGGLRLGQGGIGWEFGELLGIRTSCVLSEYVNGNEIVLHGDWDGGVYQQEVGNDFNGEPVLSVYTTPYLDLGDTETRKTFLKVNTHVRVEGPVAISFSVKYDWGNPETSKPDSYDADIENAPSVYNSPNIVYNGPNTKYNKTVAPYTETPIEGSAFSIRLNYVSYGSFAPHSLQGFILEIKPEGKR